MHNKRESVCGLLPRQKRPRSDAKPFTHWTVQVVVCNRPMLIAREAVSCARVYLSACMLLARSVFFYPVSVVLPTVAVSGTHTCSRGAGLKRFSTISRRAKTLTHMHSQQVVNARALLGNFPSWVELRSARSSDRSETTTTCT
jgi:hypothetical protein